MEGISEYTQFIESLQKELEVPILFRKQLYEKLGEKVTGLSYEEYEKGMYKLHSFKNQIYESLKNSKIFILEENIAQMLYLTDNEIFPREIPFDNFFLETSFELEDGTMVKGIHIIKEPKNNFIIASVRLSNKNLPPSTMSFDLFATKLDTLKVGNKFFDMKTEEGGEIGIGVIKNKKLQTFICNFLDFLNDPEVELKIITRTEEQNQKRINKGKFAIPQLNFIIVTGKLKIYQDKISNGIHFSYSHKFWVRGHFRILRNEERYKESIGKRTWIKPYIKGKGILLDKDYKLKRQVREEL